MDAVGGRRFALRLAALMAGALVLRVVYVVVLAGNHYSSGPVGDSAHFHELANLIGHGDGFVSPFHLHAYGTALPTAEHPPLWPLTLAVASKLFGAEIAVHRLVGAGIGAGVVGLLGLLGARLGGERAGIAAASIAAVHPLLIAADGSLMSETLFGLFVLAALLTALGLRERPTTGRALLLGALIGLAALTRGEGLLLLALLAFPASRPTRKRLAAVGATLLAVMVVLAPWAARNWTTFHRPVLVSTNYGTLIAGANCTRTYHGELIGFWDVRCRSRPTTGNEARQYAAWAGDGGRYARRHVGRLLAVVVPVRLLRSLNLWDPLAQIRLSEGRVRGVEAAGQLGFYLLLPLAIYGCVLVRRRRGPLWIAVVPVVIVVVVSIGGYGQPRFRYIGDLLEVALAGVALARLTERRGVAALQRPPSA